MVATDGTGRQGTVRAVAPSLVSSDVRRHNLALIAAHLVHNGPLSRSQIADGTGLTRGAVTGLSSALIKAGIVRESTTDGGASDPQLGSRPATWSRGRQRVRRGRPRTALELSAPSAAILALQLDADSATALVTTVAGDTVLRVEIPHGRPMGQADAVIDVLAAALGQALDGCASAGRRVLETVVVAFAPVGREPAIVLADTDLAWGAVDLLGELRRREPRLAADARLSSDSPLAAQAERSLLSGIDEMLYLKSNSGIGGASIVRGELVTGARNMAGALGHMAVVPDGAPCLCGQRGCLVTVAGPDVVLSNAGLDSLLKREGLTAALAEFVRRIHANEERALAAWQPASAWIARTLDMLTLAFDPAAIVLGGYWAELSESIERQFLRNGPFIVLNGSWTPPPIVAGALGADAAILGAVWSARDRLLLDPMRLATPASPASAARPA